MKEDAALYDGVKVFRHLVCVYVCVSFGKTLFVLYWGERQKVSSDS